MPIPLRTDFTAAQVRIAARQSKDGPQARRLLALATIYDGGTRSDAAKVGGVTLQIVRDCRVGGGVTAPTPHRPGRADFPHPVLQRRD